MKHQRQIWERIAQDYDVIWQVPDYTPILQSMIQEAEIELDMKILDMATGTGIIGIEAAKKVGKHGMVLGMDYSRPMLKQAVKKKKALSLPNINFVLTDAHSLPLRNRCVDAVTSCFMFAFLSNPQKAAAEMARVVRRGGKLASVEWEKPPLDFWAASREKGGIRDFAESELMKILHNNGFRKIRHKRIQVLHRRPNVSEELVRKSQLLVARLMGLKERDAESFFEKVRDEYKKLSVDKKGGWLPILYIGTRI